MTDEPRRQRPRTNSEQATAERRAMAEAMRIAREAAEMDLPELAGLIGSVSAEALDGMERAQQEPTLKVLHGYAEHCGTTTDYLFGLSEDVDRDPVAAMHMYVARRLNADLKSIARKLTGFRADAARLLLPGQAEIAGLAEATLAAAASLDRMRKLAPEFDELLGGAPVLRAIELARERAAHCQATIARAGRFMELRLDADDDVPQQTFSLLPIPTGPETADGQGT